MDLKNYQLSEYEEYLLERTGTENVAFDDGMVYVWIYRFRIVSAGYYAGCGFSSGYA